MQTFKHPLLRAELTVPEKEGFVCGNARLTFGEFVSRCRRLVTVLADLGTEPGDRAAVVSFNSIEFRRGWQDRRWPPLPRLVSRSSSAHSARSGDSHSPLDAVARWVRLFEIGGGG